MRSAKVVILAGGQGMRLREETEYRPKPMVEVGGRPLLWHIMRHYANYQFKEFVICLGYKGEVIKGYFLNFDYLSGDFTLTLGTRDSIICHDQRDEYGWIITLCNTGLYAETGCRIKRIEKYVRDADLILLTYGDGISNVDLDALVRFHHSHGRIATVTGVNPPSRFGELVVNGNEVRLFSEKQAQGHSNFINGGFFVLDRRVFDYVSLDPACSFEREPLQRLAQDEQLMMYEHKGFWQCVDTMRELVYLNQLWDSGHAPWFVLE